MAKKSNKKIESPKEKAIDFLKKIDVLAQKMNIGLRPTLVFPNGEKKLIAKLAIFLLKKAKAYVDISIINKEK